MLDFLLDLLIGCLIVVLLLPAIIIHGEFVMGVPKEIALWGILHDWLRDWFGPASKAAPSLKPVRPNNGLIGQTGNRPGRTTTGSYKHIGNSSSEKE